MSKKYGRQQFLQSPAPTTNPPAGFSELFPDSNNSGRMATMFPDGSKEALLTDKRIVLQVVSVAAADAIEIPAGVSVVKITASAGYTLNVVTLPAATTEGHILFIKNCDNTGTAGDIVIPAGKTVQLMALDNAWLAVGFTTTL